MAEFDRVANRQAAFIRDGGLRMSTPAQQVHESSYESLALINEQGLLTYGSQDAIDKDYERSYVQGYMLAEAAKCFVDRINLWNDDKVALMSSLKLSPWHQSRCQFVTVKAGQPHAA